MATENPCKRCGKKYPARLYSIIITVFDFPHPKSYNDLCEGCKDAIIEFLEHPPRYNLVTHNPMTNQWVPRPENMTLADIRRLIPTLGSAAYRVYDFTLSLDKQTKWWNENPWALRNVFGRQGEH